MAFFRSKKIQGVTYDFAHLEPMTFQVADQDQNFHVQVEYSCHVFTEKFDPGAHTPDLRYNHPGEPQERAFCFDRYEQSKFLPGLLTGLRGHSVYESNRATYFVVKGIGNAPNVQTYVCFFAAVSARKQGVDVLLNVRSAYSKDRMVRTARPIRFPALIRSVATGQQVQSGPPAQIKRR